MQRPIIAIAALLLSSAVYATPYRIAIEGSVGDVYPPLADVPFPFATGQPVSGWIEYDSEGSVRGQPELFGSLRYDIRVGDVDFLTSTLVGLSLRNEPTQDWVNFYSGVQAVTGYPGGDIGDFSLNLIGPPGALGTPTALDDFWAITNGNVGYSGVYGTHVSLATRYHIDLTFRATPVPEPSTLALSSLMMLLTGVVFGVRKRRVRLA
jgi:hypothetical protein